MRKQSRPDLPAKLVVYCQEWQQTHNAKANPGAAFTWYERDGKSAREHLVPLLQVMNQGHCSFCDAYPLGDRSNEPIEHFQPKSMFPEMAYAWNNLYYICERCNTAKREQWDELLLRPDHNSYEFLNYFSFTIRGDIEPNRYASVGDQHRACVTICIYKLSTLERGRMRFEEFNVRYQQNREIDFFAYRDFLEHARAITAPDPE